MKTFSLFLAAAGIAATLALAFAWAVGGIPDLAQRHNLQGVFAPAYNESATHLYFIHRSTRGWSFGPGWEHFTPPARVRASRDGFSLRRLDLESGRVEVLASWDRSPLVARPISTYRNRIFTPIAARIRVLGDSVEFSVRMSIPTRPRSEQYRLSGTWRPGPGSSAEWEEGFAEVSGYGETPLNGRWEAMTVSGPESYPSAIVAFDGGTEDVRVLVETDAFNSTYPDGLPVDVLHQQARREQIERSEHLRRTHAELLERFRGEGLSEMEAALATTREMQRLGLYPKPTMLVAQSLGPDESRTDEWPHYVIEEGEMASGVFHDIEAALADPGVEVEKSMGSYIIHRDYENSAKLNAYLGDGGLRYYVTAGGATYLMTIVRP
jgi:hypothetical protein